MPSRPTKPAETPLGSGHPVKLARSAAEAIERAVKLQHGAKRNRAPEREVNPAMIVWAQVAKASGSITARSGATLGTGSATIQDINTGSLVNASPTLTITVKNILNKTIASGSYIVIVWARKRWVVVAADDCAHLT